MSILIKGMEMPKHCWQCAFHDDLDECILLNQSCMVVWGESKRIEDCPLVEVPTPHGRLIDADALLNKTICNPLWSPYITKKMVLDAKTVIEAEGET